MDCDEDDWGATAMPDLEREFWEWMAKHEMNGNPVSVAQLSNMNVEISKSKPGQPHCTECTNLDARPDLKSNR